MSLHIFLPLLSVVLIALQFVLPAIASASSLRSNYTFGSSQQLDRASVSVVRLVATYTPDILHKSTCSSTSVTGLGALVGSWPTQGSSDITNWVVTDGSLVNTAGIQCGSNPSDKVPLAKIDIYVNTAYTNGSGLLLKSLNNCQNAPGTGGLFGCTDTPGIDTITCQNTSCDQGAVLIPFHLSAPQPFLSLGADTQLPESGVELSGANGTIPTSDNAAQALQFLTPMLATMGAVQNESGMPLLDGTGRFLSVNTKNPEVPGGVLTFLHAKLPPFQPAQQLQSNWESGVTAFYAHNYSAAQAAFQKSETPNSQFRAPAAFLALPQLQSLNRTQPGHPTPTPTRVTSANGQPVNVFGLNIPYGLLLPLILCIMLILVVGLVLFSVRGAMNKLVNVSVKPFFTNVFARIQKHSQEARDAKAVSLSSSKATLQASSVPKQKRPQQQTQQGGQNRSLKASRPRSANVPPVASPSVEPLPPPIVVSPAPVPTSTPIRSATPTPLASTDVDPLCPNCHHSISPTATFCGSCGFSLLPERSERTKVIPSSAAQPQKPQVDIPPVSPVPVQPLPIEDLKPKQPQADQDEQIPGRVGEQLGNYKLVRLLGEGGFAEVYLGEHIHLGSHAAIKVLHSQLTSKEREEFRAEARTLVNLVHPHIVRLLDFGIEGKTPYLVMDYAPHGTLRQLHPQGSQVPLSTILAYVKQIAQALQFAHDEKLIHRDIKPENMLLGRRNEVLLSDFGLAIVSQSQSSRYYGEGGKAGTAAYMSPEQFHGKPRPASDQYALGVVVYEWLCGEPPFSEGNFIQLGYQHSYVAPPPLSQSLPTIAPTVEQVVHRALAKDPAQRWPSVQAFAEALENANVKKHD